MVASSTAAQDAIGAHCATFCSAWAIASCQRGYVPSSPAEDITRRLRRADELAAKGRSGEDIAAELSVSTAQPRSHGTIILFSAPAGLLSVPAQT